MPIEHEDYRENLAMLYDTFGRDTVFIPITVAAKFAKKDYRTLLEDKSFPKKKKRRGADVPIRAFARWLSN